MVSQKIYFTHAHANRNINVLLKRCYCVHRKDVTFDLYQVVEMVML